MRNDLGSMIADLGIGSIAKRLQDDMASYKKLFDETNSPLSKRLGADWIGSAIGFSSERLAKDLLKSINSGAIAAEALSKAMRPLEGLRARAALEHSALSKLNAISASAYGLDALRSVQEQNGKLFASFNARNSIASQMGKTLAESVAGLDRLSAVTKPFASIDWTSTLNSRVSDAVKAWVSAPDWTKTLGLPVIDKAAAEAVAELWGENGVERQLRAFGIDYDATASDITDQGADSSEPNAPRWMAFGRTSFSDALSIISIILAVLVPIWQKIDSDKTETHLTGEIRDAFAVQSERLAILEELLKRALEAQQPHERGAASFVVLARVASVRETPESGSKVVAEIFPNQVVTLVREKGKWVEVEYFNWVAHEPLQGWVLKKYLLRVRAAPAKNGDVDQRMDVQ